jgi:hypothetical protein
MKTKNILWQTAVLLTIGFACAINTGYAQGGSKKPVHTEKRLVSKNGKDSTVTILTEDMDNGRLQKKTVTIHNGDTTSNIVLTENTNGNNRGGTSIVIDGDSIVKINKYGTGKNIKIDKRSVIIMNGDSIVSGPDGEDVNITIDTAKIREKAVGNKTFRDAANKGVIMSDKYIIINTKKLGHKDSAHSKWHNVIGKFGLEGFDLGFTQFIDHNNIGVSDANNKLDLNASKSVNVNFRVFDLKVNLVKHKLYLNAGLEFDLHDYGFSNNTTILTNNGKFNVVKDSVNFSRDKISTQYLELPLMLCFNSNPKHQQHSFNLGVGAYGGFLLGAYSKQVSDARGEQRIFSNFDCSNIDYGVIAQIGYGDVQIFGKYNMSSVFQTSKGAPDLQTITVGIKLFHPFGWS